MFPNAVDADDGDEMLFQVLDVRDDGTIGELAFGTVEQRTAAGFLTLLIGFTFSVKCVVLVNEIRAGNEKIL